MESPLWAMPNVIVTPHNSGSTGLAYQRGTTIFIENLGRFVRGEPMLNEVLLADEVVGAG
jgi:phosphoglycerate dehydrogenase-like enzyme